MTQKQIREGLNKKKSGQIRSNSENRAENANGLKKSKRYLRQSGDVLNAMQEMNDERQANLIDKQINKRISDKPLIQKSGDNNA